MSNILSESDIDFIIQTAKLNGAFVCNTTGQDGREEPYELNSTWFSALNSEDGLEDPSIQIDRYIASRSIALALRGVPGIYVHGLIGSSNNVSGVMETKSKRDINRQVFDIRDLERELANSDSRVSQITPRLGHLLHLHKQTPAFHPNGKQQVLNLAPEVFALLRTFPRGDRHVLALTNVTNNPCQLEIPVSKFGFDEEQWFDLVASQRYVTNSVVLLTVILEPYQVMWLTPYVGLEGPND